MLDQLRADLRFAVRLFTHTPLLTATIVLVLALGIGVNVGVFTVVHGYLTSPVPGVPENDRLVRLRGTRMGETGRATPRAMMLRSIPYPEIKEYREQRRLFAAVAGENPREGILRVRDSSDPETVNTLFVTNDYFRTLGITPSLGPGLPTFDEEDATAPLVAVIDHRIWRDQFGERPDIAGQTVRVNDATLTIVGVAPPRFAGTSSRSGGPTVNDDLAIWIPLPAARIVDPAGDYRNTDPRRIGLTAFARLQPGANAGNAGTILNAIAARHPMSDRVIADPETRLVPLLTNNLRLRGETEFTVGSGFAALITFIVLLLTCTNVSSLLVGRAIVRRNEIAIRLALGAARRRIVRQLLAESALLSVAAGAVAVAVIAVIGQLVDGLLFRGYSARVDATVVVFTFAVALGTSLLFGLLPALHASKEGVAAALKDSSRVARRSRLQNGLVVAQLTLTQPLLVALVVTLTMIVAYVPRADVNDVESHVAVIAWDRGGMRREQANAMHAEYERRIRELPGVLATAAGGVKYVGEMTVRPGDEGPNGTTEPIRYARRSVGPNYLDVMRLRLVRGRDFNRSDNDGSRAIIIGSDLATRLWAGVDPIGRRMQGAVSQTSGARSEYVVIGVVDVDAAGGSQVAGEYQIYGASSEGSGTLHIRTAGPAAAILPTARALARTVAPTTPILFATTLAERRSSERRALLQGGAAVGIAGLLILLIASVGLYAVVALAVAQRRREIGVRMAIGARAADVVRLFLIRGLRLGAMGLVFGLPLSLVALALLKVQAGGDLDVNVAVIGLMVAVLVSGVAVLASANPARRAAAVNPVIALRAE
jgi:putative ABC transport system permease protein